MDHESFWPKVFCKNEGEQVTIPYEKIKIILRPVPSGRKRIKRRDNVVKIFRGVIPKITLKKISRYFLNSRQATVS